MADQQTQAYTGIVIVGGIQLPCIGTVSLSAPEGDQNPATIGNYFPNYQWIQGLINPVVELTVAVRDVLDEALGPTLLDLLFDRTGDAAHETTLVPGGIQFWDGRSGFDVNGAKFDRMSLSMSKGGIQLTMRFCGSNEDGPDALVALVGAPAYSQWSAVNILSGQHVCWSGALDNRVHGASLEVANNHRPSDDMNCSRFPSMQNASMQTAGAQLRMRASSALPVDFTAITFTITGATLTRSFTINRPKNQTPKNRQITWPEVMRTYALMCMGTTAGGPPVAYA